MKNQHKVIAAIALIAVLALTVFWVRNTMHNSTASNVNGQKVVLSGNTPETVKEAKVVSHSNPTQPVKIVVGLKLRDEAGLDALLAQQADPKSPNYHKYLTPDEFAQRFSPTQADFDKVVAYLQSQGLKVTVQPSNRLIVGAEGTVQQVEKAFGVTINQYTWQGESHYSNDADPQVPANLQGVVQSVIGLNTFATFHARNIHGSHQPTKPGQTPSGYSPQQVATAYNYPNVNNSHKGNKYTGAGRTVAIATAYTYQQSDVDAFWKQYGIVRTGTITNVSLGGTTTQLDGETTLDLQQISSQAPGANIIMYQGVDPEFSSFTLVFNQIVVDNKADVASVSWGLCEKDTGVAQMNTENTIFKQMAAQGIPLFVAAGDDGAYDCKDNSPNGKHVFQDPSKGGSKNPAPPKPTTVDFPSSDPYVVAVGGTKLELGVTGHRLSESAWTGAGGGVSANWPRPAWQKGKGLPQNNLRNSSDVSLVADPNTGYSIYFQGSWEVAGGTSFAAPNWAALWVLVDEAAGTRVGNVNEIVYEIGQSPKYRTVFYDVTTGNNGNGEGPGFNAGAYWDHPTGWGTPDGDALAQWVKRQQESSVAVPAK